MKKSSGSKKPHEPVSKTQHAVWNGQCPMSQWVPWWCWTREVPYSTGNPALFYLIPFRFFCGPLSLSSNCKLPHSGVLNLLSVSSIVQTLHSK